jgi:hypothetical protein
MNRAPVAIGVAAEDRDYVVVAERVVAARAELEPRFAGVAEGPLADWLEGRT